MDHGALGTVERAEKTGSGHPSFSFQQEFDILSFREERYDIETL